jgi:hypothetical protein
MEIHLLHVDLVQNDWGSRRQRRIAYIEAHEDTVRATYLSGDGEDLLARIVLSRDGVSTSVTELDPTQAFTLLRSKFNNAYFFTTEPHDDSACGFHNGDEIAMMLQTTDQ